MNKHEMELHVVIGGKEIVLTVEDAWFVEEDAPVASEPEYRQFNRFEYVACARQHGWLTARGTCRKDKRRAVYEELGYKVPDKWL